MADIKHFLKNEDIYSKKCFAYIMRQERSIDIDNALDCIIAEAIISKRGLDK